MNKFEKVSLKQFVEDMSKDSTQNYDEEIITYIYNQLKTPQRATKYSAGYDFYSPMNIILNPGETAKFPTGIRVHLDEDKFLSIVPRSSLGFKYKLQLDNTIGIIDADYVNANNEGHIWVKMTNNSNNVLFINEGEAVVQGIITQYFRTEDDNSISERTGGIGSTTK